MDIKPNDHKKNKNLLFYTNKISSKPRGDTIDTIHKTWAGNYSLLETHHGYIQWLFPTREKGKNPQSQELLVWEAEEIKSDKKARERLVKSYEMMLDFYGIRLVDKDNGRLERAKNWEERFRHLNRSYHDCLRITRILESLGEFDFEHLKARFLEFIRREAFEEKTLDNCRKSWLDYWVPTLRSDHELDRFIKLSEKYGYQRHDCDPNSAF